jgi:hypothetical protein
MGVSHGSGGVVGSVPDDAEGRTRRNPEETEKKQD